MDHSATFKTAIKPTLSVNNGVAAVEFYKRAFGATELMRIEDPDGAIVAELSVGGANFFVADDPPNHIEIAPGNERIRLGLIVADPDQIAADAVAAGSREVYPVADQDYGYRLGHIIDPYGHHWEIGRPL